MSAPLLYLDAAATTPIAPDVLDAMGPWLSSPPEPAREREVRAAIEARLAAAFRVPPEQLLVLGGGTEANNLALLERARRAPARRVVAQPTEHPSVLRALDALSGEGFHIELVEVDRDGRVDPERFARAVAPGAALAVLMRANNETGVVQPVAEVAAHLGPVPLHVDAVQAARWEDVAPAALGAATVVVTAHKLDGPKGVALLVGPGVPGLPRPLTAPALPLLVGLEAALLRRARLGATEAAAATASRDALERALLAAVPGLTVTGRGAPRLPGHLHLRCPGISGEALVLELDAAGIAASTGSACASSEGSPRHVLQALGLSLAEAASSVRLSLPRPIAPDERARVVQAIADGVARLRALG